MPTVDPRPSDDGLSHGVGGIRLPSDEDATVAELYDRYGARCYSLALRITGDRGRAEAVVQEVFVAARRQHDQFDPRRGSMRSWLLTQAHHRAVEVVRRHPPGPRDGGEHPDRSPDTDPGGRSETVRRALRRLPPVQRDALELAYFGGCTRTQVANRLDVPVDTVTAGLLAALRSLRAELIPAR